MTVASALFSQMSNYILSGVFHGVDIFLNILSWLVIGSALLSWVLQPTSNLRQMLGRLVGPLLLPFRGLSQYLIRKGFMMDLSPLLAYFCIRIIRTLLAQLAYFLNIRF